MTIELSQQETLDLIFFLKSYGGERRNAAEWQRRTSPLDLADRLRDEFIRSLAAKNKKKTA